MCHPVTFQSQGIPWCLPSNVWTTSRKCWWRDFWSWRQMWVIHHRHRHKKSPHVLLILVALLTPSQIQPTSPRSLKLSDNGNIFQTLSPARAPSTGSAAFASVHRRASSTGQLLCQVRDFIIIAAILIIYIQTSKMTTTIENEFTASSMFGSVSSPREGSARKPLAFPSPTVPEVRSKSWYCWYWSRWW